MNEVKNSYTDRILHVYHLLVEYQNGFEQMKDPRATFTYAYSLMTITIANEFDDAQFRDKEWVTRLTEEFANHYIEALTSYDSDNTAPGGWQATFDVICKSKSSVFEELVICMYVHIIQDLSLALTKVGLTDDQGASQITDFHKVNDLLGLSINNIQEKVAERYNPILRWLDKVAKSQDEIFTNYGIRLGRAMSWYNANRLLDPDLKDATLTSINKSVDTFINSVRNNNSWVLRMIFTAFRTVLQLFRKWGESK